jgi:hypothetical protein
MRRVARLVLLLTVLLLAAGPATAQSRGDISAGYRFAQSEGVGYPAGWYVDATGHVSDIVSIVGDVGGTYKSDSLGGAIFAQDRDARIHTFMGGLKVNAKTRDSEVVVFGQVLFGAANLKVTTTSGAISLSRSATEPALGLSAGADVDISLPVGLRFQIGWVRVFEEGDGSNLFHFSVGAKIPF